MSTSQESPPRPEVGGSPAAPLSLAALTALVVGSMVGAGIFGMPQQMAVVAAIGPLLIGWAITGIGMLCLALVFQNLAMRRPDLDAGVFAYARAALGEFVGSQSAWGYWVAASLGNVAYVFLIMATLSQFFPVLGDGENLVATLLGSVITWLYAGLIIRGVRGAAGINVVVTMAKLIPLAVFVVFGLAAFKSGVAFDDVWGTRGGLGSTLTQVAGMMLVTVWVFLGIEGASNFSSRAKKREDVGKATVFGFLGVFILLVTVNVLSYGMMNRAEIEGLSDPSMAGVLENAVGPWGASLVTFGLLFSVAGANLSWLLLSAEILDVAGREGSLPSAFSKHNAHDTPSRAVLMSAGFIQFFLLLNLLVGTGQNETSLYTQFIYLASSMALLPYLFSALYQVLITARGETDEDSASRTRHLIIGAIALVYAIWLVYAGGLIYLVTSAILYAVGVPLFIWTRREQRARIFEKFEYPIVALVLVGALVSMVLLFTGRVAL